MTAILSGRTQLNLPQQLEALGRAADLAEGRLDGEVVQLARNTIQRAGERLRLSSAHTVAALAGATGGGKSSLFNRLSGLELSPVGVRRPTTASPYACVWEPEGTGPLLDWLTVPTDHRLSRESVLDGVSQADLRGLVLLDLPDHDSTLREHRVEVDRLLELVDLMVWVVDPQKYADALLHDRYLRPLAGHAAVTVVVLNQVDTLPDDTATGRCLADLRSLLASDGMAAAPVLATSARTGEGITDLRAHLAEAVRQRSAFASRVAADLDRSANAMVEALGPGGAAPVVRKERRQLIEALEQAAGVPAVVDAVAASYRRGTVAAAGWPFTRWIRGFRRDPLAALHVGRASRAVGRMAVPEPSPAVRAMVDNGVRQVVDAASAGLPQQWAGQVRAAAHQNSDELRSALDNAVRAVDLGVDRTPWWWSWLRAVQWVLAASAVVGLAWLIVLIALDWLALPQPDAPKVGRVPWPTLLLIAGVVLGLAVAGLGGWLGRRGARRRAHTAARRLRDAVAAVATARVFAPVDDELKRRAELRDALARAAGRPLG